MRVDTYQSAQLLEMSDEALLGIVACRAGSDQELPIARFQQQQLTAYLLHQALRQRVSPPQTAFHDLLHRELGRIDVLPRPLGIVVKPDLVRPVFPPRSFRKR